MKPKNILITSIIQICRNIDMEIIEMSLFMLLLCCCDVIQSCHWQFCCLSAIIITKTLHDLHAQEKDTVTFEVNVNYDKISYRWLKNGMEIRPTDRCQARCKQLTHTLSIRNVHFGDSANYTFIAGSAITQAHLDVEG